MREIRDLVSFVQIGREANGVANYFAKLEVPVLRSLLLMRWHRLLLISCDHGHPVIFSRISGVFVGAGK